MFPRNKKANQLGFSWLSLDNCSLGNSNCHQHIAELKLTFHILTLRLLASMIMPGYKLSAWFSKLFLNLEVVSLSRLGEWWWWGLGHIWQLMWQFPSLQKKIKKTSNWLIQMLRFSVDTQGSLHMGLPLVSESGCPGPKVPFRLPIPWLSAPRGEVWVGKSRKQMVFTSSDHFIPSPSILHQLEGEAITRMDVGGFVRRSQSALRLGRMTVFTRKLPGTVIFAKELQDTF